MECKSRRTDEHDEERNCDEAIKLLDVVDVDSRENSLTDSIDNYESRECDRDDSALTLRTIAETVVSFL